MYMNFFATEHNKQNQPDISKLQQQSTADEEVQESSEQTGDVDPFPQEEKNNDPVEQEQLHQDPMEQDQQVNGCNIILSSEKKYCVQKINVWNRVKKPIC